MLLHGNIGYNQNCFSYSYFIIVLINVIVKILTFLKVNESILLLLLLLLLLLCFVCCYDFLLFTYAYFVTSLWVKFARK
jgi:hypothetical protein